MTITDEMVEQRINSLREVYNNPEVYDLLKIVVRDNMVMTVKHMREALGLEARLASLEEEVSHQGMSQALRNSQ